MKRLIILIIIGCLLLTSCMAIGTKEDEQDGIPVLPGDIEEKELMSYTIYYQHMDENYLLGQQRNVSVPENKWVEEVLIQQLINGPASGIAPTKPVINQNTRVLSVDRNNDLFFVTLSQHFLTPLTGVPDSWEQDEGWTQEVMRQRRMAVYAIVNTLTETGPYSRVQINIDREGNGQGQRMTRGEMGFIDDPEQLLESLGRDHELIFTPKAAVELVMQAFSTKNWEKIDRYVVSDAAGNYLKPDSESFMSTLQVLDLSVIAYNVQGISTSQDGQSAIVSLDYRIRAKDGSEYTSDNVSIRLRQSDGLWKITFASMNQILNVSNG